jgi:N-acetylated-alpha-linked acidic dipeptidase
MTYPNGKWLSKDAVQPWSTFGAPYSGDRLTPGLPATKGIFRKPYNESFLPDIPAQPISYGQAKDLLQRLKGI